MGHSWGFWTFSGKRMEGILNKFMPIHKSELIFGQFDDFPHLGANLISWNGSCSDFWANWRYGLKFCMLMFLSHLQIWLCFDFASFGAILTLWNRLVIFEVLGHSLENSWKECPPSEPNHGLLVRNKLVSYPTRLKEVGHIYVLWEFFGKHVQGIAWNLACWCTLTISTTD